MKCLRFKMDFATTHFCSYSLRLIKMSLWKTVGRVCLYSNNLNIIKRSSVRNGDLGWIAQRLKKLRINENGIHTSCARRDLMEFFDDPKNWGEMEVFVGRAWKVEELRIKSNSDLHKLWYVLLKEKNMLLTMQHEYERQKNPFPNPERLDKVEESMENLETVVRERNRAYFELETGQNGERPFGFGTNCFGLKYKYRKCEHYLEKKYNSSFLAEQKLHNHTTDYQYVNSFLQRLEEKKRKRVVALKKRRFVMACALLENFPHLDEEALKMKFPDLDIEEVKRDKRSRSHQENKY